MSQITVRLQTEEFEALRAFASLTGRSMNDVIREATTEYLAADGRKAEFEQLLDQVRSRYRVALDKLADM